MTPSSSHDNLLNICDDSKGTDDAEDDEQIRAPQYGAQQTPRIPPPRMPPPRMPPPTAPSSGTRTEELYPVFGGRAAAPVLVTSDGKMASLSGHSLQE